MHITVKLFAGFRKGRFVTQEKIYEEGHIVISTIKELNIPIDEIGVVIINGRHGTFETVLKEGDQLSIFPAIGGG